MLHLIASLISLYLVYSLAEAYDAILSCSNSAIPKPSIFGLNITSISTTTFTDFGGSAGNNICYVTVTSTHSGTGDQVNTFVALPLKGWNSRFQGVGGGGWAAGNPPGLGSITALGYSAATTDAGHELTLQSVQNASSWALLSPGNVDQQNLYNFARRSMRDMTLIGQALSKEFYGHPVFKSYWNGCSTGGRQGYAMAQYYPELYDGIMANAPAIQWTALATYGEYAWSVLTSAGYFPQRCEFQAVIAAVTSACDELDGLKDNLIQAPGLCKFNATSLVGKNYTCSTDNSRHKFTPQTAAVVDKIWAGPKTAQGQFLWYGLVLGANFSGLYTDPVTGSDSDTTQPFTLTDTWVKSFLAKDYNFDTSNISLSSYADLFLQAHLEYDSILGTASPDLRRFKERGGKLITWQGLADPLVPPQQTILYYQGVQALDCELTDFYRLFFSPGVGHCSGGIGVTPIDEIAQLRAWVENGTAPATLKAGSPYKVGTTSASVVNATHNVRFLDLCPYPNVNKYDGKGDPHAADSYKCVPEAGWLSFDGPNGKDYNFYTAPGWYGGESRYSFP